MIQWKITSHNITKTIVSHAQKHGSLLLSRDTTLISTNSPTESTNFKNLNSSNFQNFDIIFTNVQKSISKTTAKQTSVTSVLEQENTTFYEFVTKKDKFFVWLLGILAILIAIINFAIPWFTLFATLSSFCIILPIYLSIIDSPLITNKFQITSFKFGLHFFIFGFITFFILKYYVATKDILILKLELSVIIFLLTINFLENYINKLTNKGKGLFATVFTFITLIGVTLSSDLIQKICEFLIKKFDLLPK